MDRLAKAGAAALVVVSMALFIFLMTKVPVYGHYKLAASTFKLFTSAWWIIMAIIAIGLFINQKGKSK